MGRQRTNTILVCRGYLWICFSFTKQIQSQTPLRSVKLENMCIRYAQGEVWVWNWIVNSILPSPNSFSDREDDASSINCFFYIIDWSIEKGEGRELHPLRRVASNISHHLGVGTMVALPGIFVWYRTRCNVWNRSKRSMCQHFLCNVLQELLDLFLNITQECVARPSADEHDCVHRYPC